MKALVIIFLIQLAFPISVEKAKKNILNNQKISKILNNVYKDSSTVNDLIWSNNPTKKSPYYLFEIRQFQDKINHSTHLYWLKVNAKNGKVYFFDSNNEKLLKI
jgi:hypothetical protein